MPEQQVPTKPRRRILKQLAAGGGMVAAAKSLPEQWIRPKVDAVLLPAHAQTSQSDTFSCGTAVATSGADEGRVGDADAIVLVFDGESCSTESVCIQSGNITCGPTDFGGNAIAIIDVGGFPGNVNWDMEQAGDTNWDVSPNLGSNNDSGTFNVTATRLNPPGTGNTFDVEFAISLSEDATEATMSVTTVITPL
ncbi:MAG TPA: hypothetical protein VK973_06960 [Arenicellales bacterium]|nr:hypothetical protein [Arenicellales bacterium]